MLRRFCRIPQNAAPHATHCIRCERTSTRSRFVVVSSRFVLRAKNCRIATSRCEEGKSIDNTEDAPDTGRLWPITLRVVANGAYTGGHPLLHFLLPTLTAATAAASPTQARRQVVSTCGATWPFKGAPYNISCRSWILSFHFISSFFSCPVPQTNCANHVNLRVQFALYTYHAMHVPRKCQDDRI